MSAHAEDLTTVRRSITVNASAKHAFYVFTEEIGTWWPPHYHLLPGELAGTHVEPRAGGRMFDVNTAGDESTWGRVITWEPPRVFAFHWHIRPDWGLPDDDTPASRVTVTFTPVEGERTRVDLVHDELDRHGEGWETIRGGLESPNGWGMILEGFAKASG
jgi:hypothetical protein